MFAGFFLSLREAAVPVSLREYLTFLSAIEKGCAAYDLEQFFYVARASLVKDEKHFDRFDRVFAKHFDSLVKGLSADGVLPEQIPDEWLRRLAERVLSAEDKALVKSLGGFDKLMEELAKRLKEQKERHQGGSKWIGTGGTSPFGAFGYHPEGVRIGPQSAGNRTAVKVWNRGEFKDFDDQTELGVRNMKVALKRLREFVREGAPDELDLDGTITATAKNAGILDLKLIPERRNRAKVLLFLDVGGSMDDHVEVVNQLFSAARTEFARLEHFYFHNCVYESLWRRNGTNGRDVRLVPTQDVLNKYGRDHKLIVVGDASMGPYELDTPGGAIHHFNEETGATWLSRMLAQWPRAAWLNPVPEAQWRSMPTITRVRELFDNRMYGLTMGGLRTAMRDLTGRRR